MNKETILSKKISAPTANSYVPCWDWLVLFNISLAMLPVEEENMILKFAIILSPQKIEKQFKSSKTLELTVDMVRSGPSRVPISAGIVKSINQPRAFYLYSRHKPVS